MRGRRFVNILSAKKAATSWADVWTLGTGQKPSVVLDFVNGRYYDGTTNAAALSTLVQNSPTVTPGSGMLCNAANFNAIGALLTALKNAAGVTLVVSTSGGAPGASAGIVSFSSGAPDCPMIANGGSNAVDAFNGGSVSGPAVVDFSKINAYATSWDNAGHISAATFAAINAGAGNFTSPITAAQLGSYNGAFTWGGFIRWVAVYPIVASAVYMRQFSWPSQWTKPYIGVTGVNLGGSSGWIGCGNTLASYFKSNTPWSMLFGGVPLPVGSIGVIVTNVAQSGSPPWYGHEVYVNTNGKLRVSIFSGWGGGAATTNLIQVEGSSIIPSNGWSAIGVTYDGSGVAAGIKMYVNGVAETPSVTFDNLTGASDTNIGEFEIGGQFGSFSYGTIDFLAMSKVARNAAYFSTAYASDMRPSVDGNTLAQYDFREGAGATTADRSGNGNTGTLHSVSWL